MLFAYALAAGPWWNEVSWPFNTVTDGENVTAQGIAQVVEDPQ